jgi:hypothetical protein
MAAARTFRRGALLLVVSAIALAGGAATAHAAFPGKPGRIVFAVGNVVVDHDLFSVDPASGSIKRLTFDPAPPPPPWFPGSSPWDIHQSDFSPMWSPRGTLIAWSRELPNPPPDPYAGPYTYTWVMDVDGHAVGQHPPGFVFAPDGSMCGAEGTYFGTARASGWYCSPQEGKKRKPPYTKSEVERVGPEWSPDQRFRVELRSVEAGWDLFLVNTKTIQARRLTFNPGVLEAAAAFAPDGSAIAWGTVADSGPAIEIYDLRTGTVRSLPFNVPEEFPEMADYDSYHTEFRGMSWGPIPVNCSRKRATQVGTAGDDVLVGTKGPDVLAGLGGKDRLIGGKGKDRLCGGRGRDKLKGGRGSDIEKP